MNIFWSKIEGFQKNFGLKPFWIYKHFGSKDILANEKFLVQNQGGPKNVGSKNISSSRNLLVQKICGPKKFGAESTYWS